MKVRDHFNCVLTGTNKKCQSIKSILRQRMLAIWFFRTNMTSERIFQRHFSFFCLTYDQFWALSAGIFFYYYNYATQIKIVTYCFIYIGLLATLPCRSINMFKNYVFVVTVRVLPWNQISEILLDDPVLFKCWANIAWLLNGAVAEV